MTNADVAATYFNAIQTGDLPKLGELVSPNIVWHQPGSNRFSGTLNGADAVFQVIGQMMAISEGTFKIDTVHNISENGDQVAAVIEFSGQRQGAEMRMQGVDVMRVQDGKIVEMSLFSGDQDAEDAFWGNE